MTIQKRTFRSKLEKQVGDLLEQIGVVYEYETHKISYIIQHHYNPDFILPNGVYLETKGFVASAVGRNPETVTAPVPDDDSEEDF